MLAKQVPAVDAMTLASDGRLRRHGVPLEMNAFCRRAVSKGVELARATGGTCTVVTVGRPSAEDVVREAVACGADQGVLVTDPALAGADTLATARAAAAALCLLGPFDLVLVGRSSVDADTGQVGPELAEQLGLPFVAAARELAVVVGSRGAAHSGGVPPAPGGSDLPGGASTPAPGGPFLEIRSERDDGWRRVHVTLPAVVSTAERLTDPCKRSPAARAEVPAGLLRRLCAADLGDGPWGEAGSPTRVGAVRSISVDRAGQRLAGPVADQVRAAVGILSRRGVLPMAAVGTVPAAATVAAGRSVARAPEAGQLGARGDLPEGSADAARRDGAVPHVAVVLEPGTARVNRELLGEAAELAGTVGGTVTAFGTDPPDPLVLGGWGADAVVAITGTSVEEDVAAVLADRWAGAAPWAVLAPGTLWGREVAARVAARLGAGLTGDAVGLGATGDRVAWTKPAFGGQLVVEVTSVGDPQMATVRPGVLARRRPRTVGRSVPVDTVVGSTRGRVTVVEEERDDDADALAAATAVVCVGQGVEPADYRALDPLLHVLGASLAGTRKVTDHGWLPRSRQVGITGHSIAPALLVLVGVGGSVNHMVSSRGSGTVVAVNRDPEASVFTWSDVGIVGDWRQVVPILTEAIAAFGRPGT